MANEQDGPIQAQGQPLPMDPLTGIPLPPPNPVATAATAAQQQVYQNIQGLAQQKMGGFQGPTMLPFPQLPKPMMPQAPSHGSQVGIPQGPFGTVGERKRADKQALFSSIGSLVNQARDKMYEKKVQTIQHDLEVLGNAIQGYNEGIQTNNQDMIKTNAQIINRYLHDDPKKVKELQKVFDVNLNPLADKKGKKNQDNEYTKAGSQYLSKQQAQAGSQQGGAPSQQTPQGAPQPVPTAGGFPNVIMPPQPRMRPDNQVQGANAPGVSRQELMKQYPQLDPNAALFMQRMPTTLQPNPAYQQYLEGLKAGQYPKAGEELTFYKDLADMDRKLAERQMSTESHEKAVAMMVDGMSRRTDAQQYGAFLRMLAQNKNKVEVAHIYADALIKRSENQLKGVEDRTKVIADKTKGTDEGKKLKASIDTINANTKILQTKINAAKAAKDTAKLKELQAQADQLEYMGNLLQQKAAEDMGLDPKAFAIPNPAQQPQLDPAEQAYFNMIFTEATKETPETTDTQ